MTRGDILLVRGTGGATRKARPCIVVQRSVSLAEATKITACPVTSTIKLDNPIRPNISPEAGTGLRTVSQIEVDWIFTEYLTHFGPVIGQAGPDVMRAIDRALRLWFDL